MTNNYIQLKNILILASSIFLLVIMGCSDNNKMEEPSSTLLNLSHLDNLGEVVSYRGENLRIIHIYADAPSYNWIGDDDEGEACVDDAARAAVVYLRHFELTGNEESAEKAKELLRFVMYMQTDDGLFYNFIWDNTLRINTIHQNSLANELNWWAGRAAWALGTGARVLADYDSSFANMSLRSVDRLLPHVMGVLETYPKTKMVNGYEMPTWLVSETASDATSELLLGLVAASKVSTNTEFDTAINKLSEGMAKLQYGNVNTAPYGAHLSWEGGWHGWGNSQTMALAEAGKLESAIIEAENFFPRLLVDGWFHSFELQNPSNKRDFEQIAYATRAASVGMIRLYEATENSDYAIMAGLLASWLNGNNVTNKKMYDSIHGYGFDGINDATSINKNSGAESTIEADFTVLEMEQFALSNKWFYATSEEPQSATKDGKNYRYRVFAVNNSQETEKIALLLNLTDATSSILTEAELAQFLN